MNADKAIVQQNKINKLYENVGYFDSYGGSVLAFLFITFFIFLIWSYYLMMQTKEAVRQDWVNQRCNPKVIPFAGWINKPEDDGKTPLEFTSENFQFCTQSILMNMMGMILSPFNALLSKLTSVFTKMSESANESRGVMSTLRGYIAKIAQNIMNRILGVMIPMQKMLMAFTDSLAKTQAIMTSGLYTMLGSYYTLQSLMGAILEMIIKMLVSLAVIVVGLWIVPFTWPAAAASTAVFLSLSVPLSIIALFMTEVLHIHSAGIPKIPSCFDYNTPIKLADGTFKPIRLIKPGDVLFRGETVTATMKLLRNNTDMYWIPTKYGKNGIIVSGCHPIRIRQTETHENHSNKWILSKDYPGSILLSNYTESVIYCFNTTSKLIHTRGVVFADWDELYNESLERILNIPVEKMCADSSTKPKQTIKTTERIFEYCESGYPSDTQVSVLTKDKIHNIKKIEYIKIVDVKLGKKVVHGGKVYGTVDILNPIDPDNPLKHLLTVKNIFYSLKMQNNKFTKKKQHDYNFNIDGLLFIK